MRRVAFGLFPFIAVSVAAFIIIFLILMNPSLELENGKVHSSKVVEEDESSEEDSWIDQLSLTSDKDYLYPINEVYLDLDGSSEKLNLPERSKMTVIPKNSYELFCITKELNSSGFANSLQKEGDAMTLLVDSADQNKLASLVTKLKTYQITATVSPYTEEK